MYVSYGLLLHTSNQKGINMVIISILVILCILCTVYYLVFELTHYSPITKHQQARLDAIAAYDRKHMDTPVIRNYRKPTIGATRKTTFITVVGKSYYGATVEK